MASASGPVYGQQLGPEKIERPAQQRERAKRRLENGAIICVEIGDRLEVWLQGSQQPDNLDIAMTFGLKPAARPHAVEITLM